MSYLPLHCFGFFFGFIKYARGGIRGDIWRGHRFGGAVVYEDAVWSDPVC